MSGSAGGRPRGAAVRHGPLDWPAEGLAALGEAGLLRTPVHIGGAPGPEVEVDGRRLVHLCSNNYLGLAADPRVAEASARAARDFGAGAGASRLVSGGTTLHRELEIGLAQLKGAEDCLVFSSGYLANVGTIPALAGEGDAIFSDELNHASVVDACRLSRASVTVYPHVDVAALEQALASTPARRRLVVTDSVFSMDGDLAPLAGIAEACERHGAMLMVDEAHATGLVGPDGAGAAAAAGIDQGILLTMGTLSKSFGAAGGFVCGRRDAVEWLRNRARTYVFDTALPAPSVAAALAALRISRAEPWRRARALDLASRLAEEARRAGLASPHPAAAIVPLPFGEASAAVRASERMLRAGALAPAIRPPSVPQGGSRIRLTAMATHDERHEAAAIAAIRAAARA